MQLKENRSGSLFACQEIQEQRFSALSENGYAQSPNQRLYLV